MEAFRAEDEVASCESQGAVRSGSPQRPSLGALLVPLRTQQAEESQSDTGDRFSHCSTASSLARSRAGNQRRWRGTGQTADYVRAGQRSLKTRSARREPPVRPELVRLGFLKFVKDRREIGMPSDLLFEGEKVYHAGAVGAARSAIRSARECKRGT